MLRWEGGRGEQSREENGSAQGSQPLSTAITCSFLVEKADRELVENKQSFPSIAIGGLAGWDCF